MDIGKLLKGIVPNRCHGVFSKRIDNVFFKQVMLLISENLSATLVLLFEMYNKSCLATTLNEVLLPRPVASAIINWTLVKAGVLCMHVCWFDPWTCDNLCMHGGERFTICAALWFYS